MSVREAAMRPSMWPLWQLWQSERPKPPLAWRDILVFDNATCSRLSTVRFATGPKRPMGHLLGAEKINFFNSRYWRSRHPEDSSVNVAGGAFREARGYVPGPLL